MTHSRLTPPAVAFVAILTVAATTAQSVAQQPAFSSSVEAIRVDVLVTDRGQVVRGLQPDDFEVRDNGVLQTIDVATFQEVPLDVILALDVSHSVTGSRLADLQNACHALIGRLTGDDRVALVTFNHAVSLREALTSDLARVRESVNRVAPSGDTALADGVYTAMALEQQDGRRHLVVVFSDGVDTASWLSPPRVLESARRFDAVVYGVVSSGSENSGFLGDLSRLTGGDVLEARSTKDLAASFLRILEDFRGRYLLSYSPKRVAKDGWHRLDVRVKEGRGVVKARPGYYAGP